ncbi:MAG: hypothetical protein K6C10_11785 [Prevotella sp.]|nr:hypothetical protein [Prevotella sp.]
MPKRINWKKGMRLTDEVMLAADQYVAESIGQAIAVAAGGRFGLFTPTRPFQLSLSISRGFVEVETLSCLAVTSSGDIIDVQFDTKYSNSFDTRVQIPDDDDIKEYFLIITANPEDWKESTEKCLESNYSFALLGPNKAIDGHSVPIGRIVYEDGWREDNVNFVPPCLCISAHSKYMELFSQFFLVMRNIDEKTSKMLETGAHDAISIYWPVVQQMMITANTEQDIMTPQQLLSCVQRVIAAFTCACDLDKVLSLEEADVFQNYARTPFNYRNAYIRIKQGLGMCYAINEKIDKFSLLKQEEPVPEPQPMPEPKPEPKPDPRRFWEGKQI